MPADFSGQAAETAQPVQREPLSEFVSIAEAVSSAELPIVDLPAAPSASITQPSDSHSQVRKWQPEEVRATSKISPVQSVVKPNEGSNIEEIRQKLIVDLMTQAGQILASAQAQATEIVRQAQESAQQVLLDSQQRGWKAAEAETIPMIQSVQAIIDSVQSWRDEMFAQSETAVLNLVKDISQTLFCEGMVLNEEELQQTFNKVLSNARSLGELRIFVHPEDAMILGPYWREYQVSISGQQLEIIPSDSIRRGGCFVEGQMGTVDGRVETQLNAIMGAISHTADQNAAVR